LHNLANQNKAYLLGFFTRLGQRLQRKPLASAIGLALLVHFGFLWDGEFEWPDFTPDTPDEVLSKKKADYIPRVKLNIKPPARPKAQVGATIVTLVEEAPPQKVAPEPKTTPKPKATKKPVAKSKPKPKKIKEPITKEDSLINTANTSPEEKPQTDNQTQGSQTSPAVPLGDALPPPPKEVVKVPPAPAYEPPPPFPIKTTAIYKASIMGVSTTLTQVWLMEGDRYSIDYDASKFGLKASMRSEGRVSEAGISPEHFKMYINKKLRSFADIDRSTSSIRYGKGDDVKYTAIQYDIQDAASLPFQVAVSFTGTETRQMQVTTGSSVYNINLHLVAEEVIRLPAGDIKTLHLQGQRINLSTGQAQQGYDVWLAPDYRNFPVKFRGPTSKGEVLEYRVKSLAFEGQTVLGKDVKPEPESHDDEIIPKELLEQHNIKPEYEPILDIGEDAP
jgi:hypothetical protein